MPSSLTRTLSAVITGLLAVAVSLPAQQPPPGAKPLPVPVPVQSQAQPAGPAPADPMSAFRPNYFLGIGDQIVIRAAAVEEIGDRPYRVEPDGNVTLPLVGKVKAAELSVSQLEAALIERLRVYIRNPLVSITVVQYRSDPAFFIGAFRLPGIYALEGRRTLVEMLTRTGGLAPNASRRIKVTRRKEIGELPLPSAIESPDGTTVSAEIALSRLWSDVNPVEDIRLEPFDVISVERAEQVYVTGEVARIGGVELGERDFIPISQMLILSGGLKPDADAKKAFILRPILYSQQRAEILVDVEAILQGKGIDSPLLPNDILVVPRNGARAFASRVTSIAIPALLTAGMLALIPSR